MSHPAVAASRGSTSLKTLGGSLHARNSSPTAHLLRNSRVFAIPHPLSRPDIGTPTPSGGIRKSDTATLPYPTHQAIATTPSALGRGDWGLKRPLPLRVTTGTSTPHFRIKAIDTLEHVTEFESSADHTRTLEKFTELGLPLSRRVIRQTVSRIETGKSVFDSEFDNTDKTIAHDRELKAKKRLVPWDKGAYRWRFEGPWVGGMTQSDFMRFAGKSTGKDSRKAFREYIRGILLEEEIEYEIWKERDESTLSIDVAERHQELARTLEISDSKVEKRIRDLRSELRPRMNNSRFLEDETESKLIEHLITFLDLPPPSSKPHASDKMVAGSAQNAPPSTHPSAGLGYLRTSAYLTNHPLLGPQAARVSTPGRVMQTKTSASQRLLAARLGVAGIVVDDQKYSGENEKGVTSLDYETEGGTKIWVKPTKASITPDGRIKMEVARASEIESDIQQNRFPTPQEDMPLSYRGSTGGQERWMEPLDSAGRKAPKIDALDTSQLTSLAGQDVQNLSANSKDKLTQELAELMRKSQELGNRGDQQ